MNLICNEAVTLLSLGYAEISGGNGIVIHYWGSPWFFDILAHSLEIFFLLVKDNVSSRGILGLCSGLRAPPERKTYAGLSNSPRR